jgi:thiosulfate/3-mercaptopyruvate sulfurtransferase
MATGPLVSAAWLRAQFGRAGLVVVDCRFRLGQPGAGRRDWLEGHVPGAAFLDVDGDLADEPGERGRHPLPRADWFQAAARRAGIDDDSRVVAYDEAGEGGAVRLWWLLRHFGHDDCAVIDLESWHGPLAAGEEQVERREFTPRPRLDDTIDAEEVMRRGGELVVVDARPPNRWRGEPNPIDTVPGRIPGALNAPWNEPAPHLPPGELVAYCGSGVTATVLLHGLHITGRDGRLYPGSWSEWEQLGLPVERS